MQDTSKPNFTAMAGFALLNLVLPWAPMLMSPQALAQNLSTTPSQKAVAQQVAQAGVPLDALAPGAPDSYTVKSGDTLWAISGLFLKSPWRWPELWGMNLQELQNPHRIYPAQVLVLEKKDGIARLTTTAMNGSARGGNDAPLVTVNGSAGMPTVKISPRTRYEALSDSGLPTLKNQVIEPFLVEALIVDEGGLLKAPRIVSTQEGRVLLSRGDRAYALGDPANPVSEAKGEPQEFRVFRNVTPLKDPLTSVVLGYEAQFVGKAQLVRGQAMREVVGKDGKPTLDIVPATIDIVRTKEEMRVGDRLLPEPPREMISYVPRAPEGKVDGRIVSVYGSAVVNAAQSQVVVLNRGSNDGLQSGHVLALLKAGPRVLDRTSGTPVEIKLPDERNGLLMVFRTFEKLSYALILQITDGAKIGDHVVNPN